MEQVMNQMPMQGAPKKSVGPIIGIVLIVIVLIIGALYFWGDKLNKEQPLPEQESTSSETGNLSTSDSLDDISADLSATVINGTDTDLENINNELAQ